MNNRNRPAFTVVELMIALSISTIVIAGVLVFFSGANRLGRDAYQTVEGALSNRVVRAKQFLAQAQAPKNVDLPMGEALDDSEEEP